MIKNIFFQSSLPRSGSTLLQNILGQNPEFYVTPTSGVLELVFAARHNYSESLEFKAQDSVLMEEGFRGFCNGGLTGFYNSITDKPYVMDKSRDNLGDLKVSKDDIIEDVAEKILTQDKVVAVIDKDNEIIGSINPTKIINTVFGGRKNNN